jgi:hypothetical protein
MNNYTFDLSTMTEKELLEKLLLIKGIHRNGLIELIKSTRHYELGLELAELFEFLLQKNQIQLDNFQIDNIQLLIVQLRLTCLDCLDRWNAYIHYYDEIISTNYESFGIEAMLNIQEYRYDIIKRKIDKASKSKKLGNSVHKLQSELTDKEIETRARNIIDRIKQINKNW